MYSSIVKKSCKCGCDKMPTLGFKGYNADCRPDLKEAAIDKIKKRNAAVRSGRELRGLAYQKPEIKAPTGYKRKPELLKEADRLFADYIKRRDTGKDGMVYCPCCKKHFNAEDVDKDGNRIINCMHFCDRDIYLLRFDEDAAHAGHSWCNKNQHYAPSGVEYQNFKQFLITKFGEPAVLEMELAKRKINRIEESQLKNVIEHYG